MYLLLPGRFKIYDMTNDIIMRVNLLVYRFRHLVIELNVSPTLGGRLLTPFFTSFKRKH